MTLAKFFARIGLDVDQKKAVDFEKSVKNILIALTGATLTATGFVVALKKITDETIETSLAFKQFEAETGASVETLQRWQAVADQTNNSAQEVAESIKAITLNQEKIKLGQGNISGYQLLGIDPTQDPFEILEKLREKTKDLDQGMKKHVLSQIGVSSKLIQVLELTNSEFDKMSKQAFVIPKSVIDNIDKIRASTKELGQGINWLKAQIVNGLAPNIIKLNKLLVVWIKNNKDGVIKTVKQIFLWLQRFTGAIINAVKMINTIIEGTIGWKNALIALLGIMALLNAAFLVSPLGLFIAGMVLLVAVLDDLYVYSKGGKSLFGVLMKKFPELEKKLNSTLGGFKDFLKVIGFMDSDKFEIDDILKQWGAWGIILKGVADSLELIFALLTGDEEVFNRRVADTKIGNKITDFLSNFYGGVQLAPSVKERIEKRNTVVNITNNITSNADAEEVGKIVDERTQRSLNAASNQRVRNE